MRRNNMVRLDGLLAQETVELASSASTYRVRVAVDTAAPDAGGRHWVLLEDRRAVALAAYLAVVQAARAPLSVSVIGSLSHERGQSVVRDVAECSFCTSQFMRNQAEELIKAGARLQPARGPHYPLGQGYHNCVYLGGWLDLSSLSVQGDGEAAALVATLDTVEADGTGRHRIAIGPQLLRASLMAVGEGEAGEVEANVRGTLHTLDGFTTVMVTGIEFPLAYARRTRNRNPAGLSPEFSPRA